MTDSNVYVKEGSMHNGFGWFWDRIDSFSGEDKLVFICEKGYLMPAMAMKAFLHFWACAYSIGIDHLNFEYVVGGLAAENAWPIERFCSLKMTC